MSFTSVALSMALLLAVAGPSAAQTVKLEFADGRVTLVAENAPVRQILAEWARLGGTRIVNGDRVAGPPVTLELTGYPERQALEIVLRNVPGYMVSARDTPAGGASYFDRILILATTTTPRPAGPVASFVQPTPQVPMLQQDDFDDPTELPVGVARPRPVIAPGNVVIGGATPAGAIVIQPAVPEDAEAAPRPAPPGQGTPGFGNPFTTLPGSSRPGEITPAPQPDNRPGAPNAPNAPGAVR